MVTGPATETPTSLVAAPYDPRWEALREPFPDDVLEWKPQPLVKVPRLNNPDDERRARRAMSGRCVKGSRAENGDLISADDFYCDGYHVRSVHIAYVGHAELTIRLNEVCTPAGWDWKPVGVDADGWPVIQNGGMWVTLTILGVTKLGFGDMGDNKGANGVKELIGDALRNAAMRFGIATYLWSRSERSLALKYADAAEAEATNPPTAPPVQYEAHPSGDPNAGRHPANGPAAPEKPPAGPTELQLAIRRHAAAIARAHPEWSREQQQAAVTNAFKSERTNASGGPVTVAEASAADWNWMATYWEDEADEAEAERHAALDADYEASVGEAHPEGASNPSEGAFGHGDAREPVNA